MNYPNYHQLRLIRQTNAYVIKIISVLKLTLIIYIVFIQTNTPAKTLSFKIKVI